MRRGWRGAHRAGVETEPVDRSRRQVVHEDIRAGEQPLDDAARGRLLEIERQRLLRAIEPDEIAGQPLDGGVVVTGEIAALGALDLDHARAEIGELARRERRRHGLLDRHDDDPVERTRHQYERGRPRTCSAT
jgi:hypothetical protein